MDSSLARLVWALMAVRTDMLLESRWVGAADEQVRRVSPSDFLARMYFFRGSLRSLYSTRVLLQRVAGDPEFKDLAFGHGQLEAFRHGLREVNRFETEFTGYRNRFGGHVEHDVANSLDEEDPERELLLSVNDESGHGLEVGEAAFAATLDAEVDGADAELFELIRRMRDATTAAARCINLVMKLYALKYPLEPA